MEVLKEKVLTLADLPKGATASLVAFHDVSLSLRLMQLGFLPGAEIKVNCHAPLGCPVCISFDGDYHVTLRKSEAETIEVELMNQ